MPDLWELTKKAKAGDIDAQLAVAHAFETGEGVEENMKEAFNWYKTAAENGDAEGYYRAGCCVRKLAPSKTETIAKWFYEAARIGHLESQKELGFGYFRHLPVENKENEEIYWLRKAAEQGNKESQTSLGIKLSNLCYFDEAISWLNKASKQGSAEAKFHLGELYRVGLGVGESSPKKAFQLYKESAEGFCPEGMRELGKCYLEGFGTDEDENEAFYWFKEGAGFDDAESNYHLGRCYHSGWGTPHNDEAEFSAFL